jgi:hypothetical protein
VLGRRQCLAVPSTAVHIGKVRSRSR